MNIRAFAFLTSVLALNAAGVPAQTPRGGQPRQPAPATVPVAPAPIPAPAAGPVTPAPTQAAPTPERPRRPTQAVNIKTEFTITDQRGAQSTKRTISVIAADGNLGRVRSMSEVSGIGAIPLNVDATPLIEPDGKIRLAFTLQYDWPAPPEKPGENQPFPFPTVGKVVKTTINDSVTLILQNGQSIVAVQSADAIGERQVIVEVKATILR